MGMEIIREFAQSVANSGPITISNTVCEHVGSILLRNKDDLTEFGFTTNAENANVAIIEFLSDNGVTLNSELTDFIHQWRVIQQNSNPKIGLECSRSLTGNTVFIGGKIRHDLNWFIGDYIDDIMPNLPANTDIRHATEGGIKLGYDLTQERFTSIKIYSRGGNEIHNNIGHNAFLIDANNDLTFQNRTFCQHSSAFTGPDDAPDRWVNVAQTVVDIINKYNGVDRVGVAWRTTERVPNSDGILVSDQGGITLTAWQLPDRSNENNPPVINNPYEYLTTPNENEWYSPANTANTIAY